MILLAVAAILAASVVCREVLHARSLEGAGYALAGMALGAMFVFTLSWRLVRSGGGARYHGWHS
jgi:surfactin synthase thioesterase subunit